MTESYKRNCYIVERKADHDVPLFHVQADGKTYCRLDGYAIVPKEIYFALREALRKIGAYEKDAREMVAKGFHNTTLAIDLSGMANAALTALETGTC